MVQVSVGLRTKVVALLSCAIIASSLRAEDLRVQQARSRHGMVVSDSPEASRVGRDILARGGNAVDAAVATAFALAVTWPEAGNIGGGGFMMVHPGQDHEPVCIEYRETAPASATNTMFTRSDGPHTHKIVGVPGTVRGLALAHEKFGKLPWQDLVLPAVKLADDGFVIDKSLAQSINSVLNKLDDATTFDELRRVYGHPDVRKWKAGDNLVLKDLAMTLRLIAADGAEGFYRGKIADLLVAEMQRGNGRITKADLAAYKAIVRQPIRGTFRGFDVYGPPPPSSGGICLVEMLNILEQFDLKSHGRWSPETIHLTTEAMRRAYSDRARYLGDEDFVKIPKHLIDKEYAKKLAAQIDRDRATPSESIAKDIPIADESPNTTHFSVIDGDGMAVSNTYTLESSWGSRIVVRGAGFLLNNEMGDFNWLPGVTTRGGRIGTEPNQIAPHKRMLSSQTPTILTRDGQVVLITGTPGGRTIINTVLNIVLNVAEFEMPLPEAIEAPRLHHQWFPDKLNFEGAADPKYKSAVEQLTEKWRHVLVKRTSQGSAHSIWVDVKSREALGVADHRRGGLAAGVISE